MDRPAQAEAETQVRLPDRIPWNQLKPESVAALLSQSASVSLRRGDEVRTELGIVLSGAFAVEQHLSDGRRVLPELFPLSHLVDLRRSSRMRQGRLIALKPSTILVIDERWLDHNAAAETDIAAAAVKGVLARA